ncbi:MAG TPA: LuxR C-terminal-related transcriptional regulator [Candidatus Elarobacter sp.]|nr:LuxR C-terminal-related transcriptional regulator [Candidatus Elarobacter sp.]
MTASRTPLFPRERIFARLDAVRAAPIALVAASAASGKSTVLREYEEHVAFAHVRFDGSPEHAIPEEFLRGFAAALADVAPSMASSIGPAAARFAKGEDDDDDVLGWACEHLANVETTLVLDDLHHALANPRVARFLRRLIDATHPRVRWMLITRSAEQLPVARWMATGAMELPVDDGDVAISLEEFRAAAAGAGSPLDEGALVRIHQRMQGWPLGLAVALGGGHALDPDLAGRDALYDAVADAALGGRTPEAQDETFAAALAGRFDADLLARMHVRAELAAELESARLVYELEPGTYAFHEPYRERLLRRVWALDPARNGPLVRTVGDALLATGRWSETVALLLQSGDRARIADVVEERGFAAFDRGEATSLREALAALPDDVIAARPRALAMKAALAGLDDQSDLSEAWFRMAIEAADGDARREIVVRYGLDLVRRGREDAVALLEAETSRSGDGSEWDAVLWGLLGSAYVGARRMDDARSAARRALQRIGDVTDRTRRARILHQAAYVALNDHDHASAKDLAQHAVIEAEAAFAYDIAARALSVLYVLAIDVDDDAAASREHLRRLDEMARKAGNGQLRLYATLNAYELEMLAGNTAAIERLDAELRELQVFLTPLASETLLPAQALRASWDGRFEHAYQLLAPSAVKQFDDDRRAQRWAEAATYAAAAGLRSEAAAAMRASRAALRKIDPSDRWALRSSAYLAIAEVLLAHDGRARSAIADLRRSARRGGVRFTATVDAIRALHARWRSGWYGDPSLGDAIDRLETLELGGFGRFLGALPLPSSDRARAALLSEVEKSVLRLVAGGATSKEIAAELDRSPQTVNVHLRTICRKLGCSGRRQAVAFAIREGLIQERRAT